MPDFYRKIQQVLELEKKKGYKNSAVAGGLEKFTEFINRQGLSENIPAKFIAEFSDYFQIYSSLSLEERESTIDNFLKLIPEKHVFKHSDSTSKDVEQPSPNGQNPALYAQLQSIQGIGNRNVKYFEKLGINNIYQLIRYFPRKYQDFSQLKTINEILYGEEVTLTGVILGDVVNRKSKRGNLLISEGILSDSTGNLKLTWFNQPFIKNQLKSGMPIVVSGKVDMFRGRFTMSSPVWERLNKEQIHTNRIVPIYPATSGISQRQIRNIIKKNIDFWSNKITEYLPDEILNKESLTPINNALLQVHFPASMDNLENSQKRFAFEEIFFLQLGFLYQKSRVQKQSARNFPYETTLLASRKEKLPYKLTNAQDNAIKIILDDLTNNTPMNRLLQGDVGSGKTVVAKFAVEAIIKGTAQAAILAPTSILAEQHFNTISDLLFESGSAAPDEVAILLGKTNQKEKSKTLSQLSAGKIKCIIGTHALLEDPVIFSNLQLIVVDEQHRFGVNQRNKLKSKGDNPHTLVMSATPIPRSLALTVYGDLDVTTIDEMPPGRLPVRTEIVNSKNRNKAYELIREQINQGFQAFIVYPMIDADEENVHKSAVAEKERLQTKIFPQYKVALLHGKMKPSEKENIMYQFREHQYDILVSTTVIEVGVDIPGVTIIIIESANFFGLAQLHQIRGRVGRNSEESYCILIPESDDAAENKRLQAMVDTNDGFKLADIDLNIRGPGDFLGTRQSGYVDFKFASIADARLIEKCLYHVRNIINSDPLLINSEHLLLREELSNRWPGLIEIND